MGWDEPNMDPPNVHVRVLAGLGSVSRVSVWSWSWFGPVSLSQLWVWAHVES